MIRQVLQLLAQTFLVVPALVVAAAALVAASQEPTSEAKKDKPAAEADEQARSAAERIVRGIEMEIRSGDQWTKVERIEEPLLFYTDPTRKNDRGSVWGWGKKGRPVALLELYRGEHFRMMWTFAICNTSGGKVRAHRTGAPWWNENDSAAELKDIPGVPTPSAEAKVRQRQLKQLAEKFSGHEFWDPGNTKYDLRLLKRPLCSYRDEANGLLDGGLFTLANGTNPEIVFFVEARVDPKDSGRRVWQYTVGRLAHAELHLEHDGKEVFEAPRGNRVSGSNQPYWLSFLPAVLPVAPDKP